MSQRSLALLEEVGLADRSSHLPSHLSGGAPRRFALRDGKPVANAADSAAVLSSV